MRTVRCCAVALGFDPERVATLETFARSVDRLVERHVAKHPTAPTLVAFPEHTGLLAAFVGARGEQARRCLTDRAPAVEVLTALAVGHADPLGHYARTFPGVTSAGRLLHLALTDTIVRGVVETFAALARDRGLWVSVGAALPAGWERVTDDRVGSLAASDVDRSYVYVATTDEVRNRNLVLDPEGRLAAVHDKAYLVPMERDPDAGLGLHAVGLDEVHVADLPIGRLGTVISKDAWMPDVNERLDQLGAQLLVQPEAFDRWGRPDRDGERTDLWPPDKFQRGGWWMVQRHRAIEANATPVLVGNLGDLPFDGQPLVAVEGPAGDRALGLLGQPSDAGWAAVGGWDGLEEPPEALADPDRRRAFVAHAERLAPGSRDPLEGAAGDDAAWADVRLTPTPRPRPTAWTELGAEPSVEVPGEGTQLVPDLVADGDGVWLAWVVCGGATAQGVAVARGDGTRWDPPVAVHPQPRRDTDQFDRRWRPRLAVVDGAVVCAYLGFPSESWDLFATVSRDGAAWTPPVRVDDAHTDAGVLRERGHDAPALVTDSGGITAVWSDLRWPWVLPQVRLAGSRDQGRTWTASRRVDGRPLDGQPDPTAGRSRHETRGQAAPAVIATPSGLVVLWQELDVHGRPGVWLARIAGADDAADVAPVRLDGARRSCYRPAVAAAGATIWAAWEERDPDGGGAVVVRTSRDGGWTWGAVTAIPGLPAGATQRRATLVALDPHRAVGVLEDDREGPSRIVVTSLGADGTATEPARVCDTPPGEHAHAPAAVLCGRDLVVAWQDTRGRTERVRTARVADVADQEVRP